MEGGEGVTGLAAEATVLSARRRLHGSAVGDLRNLWSASYETGILTFFSIWGIRNRCRVYLLTISALEIPDVTFQEIFAWFESRLLYLVKSLKNLFLYAVCGIAFAISFWASAVLTFEQVIGRHKMRENENEPIKVMTVVNIFDSSNKNSYEYYHCVCL